MRLLEVFTRDAYKGVFFEGLGNALMNDDSRSTPEFESYISALRSVFHGETWGQIEIYAARAWRDCGLGESASWEEVSSDIRNAFLKTQGSETISRPLVAPTEVKPEPGA